MENPHDVRIEVSGSDENDRAYAIAAQAFANNDSGFIVEIMGRIPKDSHSSIRQCCQMIIDALDKSQHDAP